VCSVTRNFKLQRVQLDSNSSHALNLVSNDARFYIAHIQIVYTARTFLIFMNAYLYAAYFPDSSVEGVETLL
jgi:hypothetical protein